MQRFSSRILDLCGNTKAIQYRASLHLLAMVLPILCYVLFGRGDRIGAAIVGFKTMVSGLAPYSVFWPVCCAT